MRLFRQHSMAFPPRLGVLLLAVWLIAWGVIALLNLGSPVISTCMNILAIAAGIGLLLDRR